MLSRLLENFVFSLILEANNAFSCHLNRLECFKKDVSGGGKCPSPDLYAYDFGGLDSGGCVMGFAVGQFYYCEEVAGSSVNVTHGMQNGTLHQVTMGRYAREDAVHFAAST